MEEVAVSKKRALEFWKNLEAKNFGNRFKENASPNVSQSSTPQYRTPGKLTTSVSNGSINLLFEDLSTPPLKPSPFILSPQVTTSISWNDIDQLLSFPKVSSTSSEVLNSSPKHSLIQEYEKKVQNLQEAEQRHLIEKKKIQEEIRRLKEEEEQERIQLEMGRKRRQEELQKLREEEEREREQIMNRRKILKKIQEEEAREILEKELKMAQDFFYQISMKNLKENPKNQPTSPVIPTKTLEQKQQEVIQQSLKNEECQVQQLVEKKEIPSQEIENKVESDNTWKIAQLPNERTNLPFLTSRNAVKKTKKNPIFIYILC